MSRFRSIVVAVVLTAASLICLRPAPASAADAAYMDETYRPQVHYSAEKNMINDPNGLVYFDGKYHLFHQYNVFDAVYWGHATSTDLVHWTHLPPAIAPDGIGQIFSGSVVVDTDNTSGLATGSNPVLVALFTYGEHNGGPQSQGLAYSNDKGTTWQMHPDNPVIPNTGQPNFRDPKVFWHEPTHQWIMVLTVSTELQFWNSSDLVHRTYGSSWGAGQGAHGGQWECPDLFPIEVEGTSTTKWVLSVSVDSGAPAGGVGMQYFVGDFDGSTFTNDNSASTVLWQNYGKDYYAGVTWGNVPASDGRRLMIAWNDSWQYRFGLPTTPFNGQLSLVRQLKLESFPEGLRLTQNPVAEYDGLRGSPQTWSNQTITPSTNLLSGVSGDTLEINATFQVSGATATEFGIKVRTGKNGQATPVGYDRTTSKMYVDRTNSGVVPDPTGFSPNPNWAGRHSAPLAPVDGKVTLRMFVDRSSVEVFGNGREQISDLILPDRTSTGLATYAIGGNVTLTSLTVYPLASVWADSAAKPDTNLTGAWSTVSGEWADTAVGRDGSNDGSGYQLAPRTGSDFTYSTDVTIRGVVPGNDRPIKKEDAAGLVFRANDTATEGYTALLSAKDDTVVLPALTTDGTTATIASVNRTLDTSTKYTLKAVTAGTSIKIYVDDDLVIDTTDTRYQGGFLGLTVRDSASLFDAINATVTTDFSTNLRGWTAQNGTWDRTATGMQGSSAGDAYLMSEETAADFTYGADIRVQSTGGRRAGTLVFRSNDDASQAYGLNLDAGADVVTFFTWGSGGGVIASHPMTLDTDRTYNLAVRAIGSSFTVTVDGATVITATDATYTTGKLGLDVYNSTATLQNVTLNRHPTGWTNVAGTWTEPSPTTRQGSSSGDGFSMSTQTATNFTYTSEVNINGTAGGGDAAALVFRANAAATTGYVANVDAAGDVVTLFRFNPGGGATTLARHVYSIDADRTYTLGVIADDDHLTVKLDGVTVIDVHDATYTSGLLGLNTWNSQATFTDTAWRPRPNLVTNAGFEYGDLRGWTEWHPAVQPPAYGVDGWDVYDGARKLYFYATTPYEQSIHQFVTTLPNGSYTVTARVKLNQAATISRMELGNYGSPTVDVPITAGSNYQLISGTVTISNNQLDIGFYVNGPANTSLQIDDVTLSKA